MAALADGAVGGEDRATYRATVGADHGRQTTSGDGVSRLPGDHSTGREVHPSAHGGSGRTCAADGRVPLPQYRLDSEELPGPATPAGVAGRTGGNAYAARQHSRRRVLR